MMVRPIAPARMIATQVPFGIRRTKSGYSDP